jgi:hypothetical protein
MVDSQLVTIDLRGEVENSTKKSVSAIAEEKSHKSGKTHGTHLDLHLQKDINEE